MKEFQGDSALGLDPTFYCPARLSSELTAKIHAIVLKAHRALGCTDLSRTDIRLDRHGTPFVLEVNPLPGLDPHESNFPIMSTAAGIPYPAVINRLVDMALGRTREVAAHTQELSANLPVPAVGAPVGVLAVSRTVP